MEKFETAIWLIFAHHLTSFHLPWYVPELGTWNICFQFEWVHSWWPDSIKSFSESWLKQGFSDVSVEQNQVGRIDPTWMESLRTHKLLFWFSLRSWFSWGTLGSSSFWARVYRSLFFCNISPTGIQLSIWTIPTILCRCINYQQFRVLVNCWTSHVFMKFLKNITLIYT